MPQSLGSIQRPLRHQTGRSLRLSDSSLGADGTSHHTTQKNRDDITEQLPDKIDSQ